MKAKALELRNVSVIRDGITILDSIDLDILQGENVAIIGPNGSGKSTLMKLLRGDILPYYGEDKPAVIKIFGKDRWNIFDLRSRMGIVSMDLQNQFDIETPVWHVIGSGLFSSMDIHRDKVVTNDIRVRIYNAAVLMGIEDILNRTIETLSLGEMRRALIARALVNEPDILILDEPMAGLDIVMRSKFRRMFDILIAQGVSIVMITHELSDIPQSVDRILGMKDGKIIIDGPKDRILTDDAISEIYGESIKVTKENGAYQMHLSDEGSR